MCGTWKIPESIGVDTWAVDFVLLDAKDQRLGDAVGYRDHRTQGMDQSVYEVIDEEELYLRTGIQKQPFNTIYQLMAVKEQIPELMEQADALLMIPDYLHFFVEWTESDGIHQRFHHTAFGSADKGLGLESYRLVGL